MKKRLYGCIILPALIITALYLMCVLVYCIGHFDDIDSTQYAFTLDESKLIGIWEIEDPNFYSLYGNDKKYGWELARLELNDKNEFVLSDIPEEMKSSFTPMVRAELKTFSGKWNVKKINSPQCVVIKLDYYDYKSSDILLIMNTENGYKINWKNRNSQDTIGRKGIIWKKSSAVVIHKF